MNDLKPLKNISGRGFRLFKFFKIHQKLAALVTAALVIFTIWFIFFGTSTVITFIFGPGTSLKVENGRVNVLLLGIPGGKHEGATLTDTVIVASYDVKEKRVDLISLPRDLWLDKHKAKINTLYQTGLLKGDGLEFVAKEIGESLGIGIPYIVRVDFLGFVKAVDLVEGIDVEVARSFDDYKYPIAGKENDLCGYKEEELEIDEGKSQTSNLPPGKHKVLVDEDGKIATDSAKVDFKCRFEHISFGKGLTHMDGATALKFVRSRSGTNNEGSDFARSKRQQQILQAFKDKALSLDTLTDVQKVIGLLQTFGTTVVTNIPQRDYLEAIRLSKRVEKVNSFALGPTPKNSLLITPADLTEFGGSWILIPPNNDFSKIKEYLNNVFSGKVATDSAGVAR